MDKSQQPLRIYWENGFWIRLDEEFVSSQTKASALDEFIEPLETNAPSLTLEVGSKHLGRFAFSERANDPTYGTVIRVGGGSSHDDLARAKAAIAISHGDILILKSPTLEKSAKSIAVGLDSIALVTRVSRAYLVLDKMCLRVQSIGRLQEVGQLIQGAIKSGRPVMTGCLPADTSNEPTHSVLATILKVPFAVAKTEQEIISRLCSDT